MSKNYWLRVEPTLEILVQKYPMAFFPKDSPETKPLMRGIFTFVTGGNPEIPRAIIAESLRRYTLKNRYLKALATHSHRIALDGAEVESVSEKHRNHAIQILLERQSRRIAA